MRKIRITESITEKTERAVAAYFNELAHLKTLSVQEENDIARRAAEGNQLAIEKLITSNLRFVVTVAKKYQHNGLPLADLISEGNLGLIEAAKRFDETRGFKFITYAIWWVRQSIIAAIHQHQQLIRLPVTVHHLRRKVYTAELALEAQQGVEATAETLCEILNLSEERFMEVIRAPGYCQSLDQPIVEDDGATLLEKMAIDALSPLDELEQMDRDQRLESLLAALSDRSRRVLELVYGLSGGPPLTNKEAAEYFNLSSESIRLIRNKAIDDCRCLLENKYGK